MKFPFPLSSLADDLFQWAIELIPALEAPSIGDDEAYRHEKTLNVSDATYEVKRSDYLIQADTTSQVVTVTLPLSKADGWECEVVKIATQNRVVILPTGTDTLVGDTSVVVYVQWTALKFRAVEGGYILV